MKYLIVLIMSIGFLSTAHDCNPQKKTENSCVAKKVVSKKKSVVLVAAKPVIQPEKQVQSQQGENEQEQHQVVNVYNNPLSEHRVYVERRVVEVSQPYNNRIGFLFGFKHCCSNQNDLFGGAYYSRRIAGPFNLGVGALTNRSYFGMLGIDF